MSNETARRVYTVTQLNRHVKNLLADDYLLGGLWISGEISNYKPHSSGHRYFTLKDNGGAISAVMFASDAASLSFLPRDGLEVVVYGSVSLYEKTGQYQIYIRKMEPMGRGSLYQAFEELKNRLAQEGLFDPAHKKILPAFPRKIGIATSATGAAVQDMIQIARRRFPGVSLVLCPCPVQGRDAAPGIVRSIRMLDRLPEVDVIIVGRGGGSIEDLWAFNEEEVARAIYEARTPVVSAVGHETDFTIADFVSDLRAPTPSAAAELCVPNAAEELRKLKKLEERGGQLLRHRLLVLSQELKAQKLRLAAKRPGMRLADWAQQADQNRERMARALAARMGDYRSRLALYAKRVSLLDPLKPLEKGYAYVSDESGRPLMSVEGVRPGDGLSVRLADGSLRTRVEEIRKEEA